MTEVIDQPAEFEVYIATVSNMNSSGILTASSADPHAAGAVCRWVQPRYAAVLEQNFPVLHRMLGDSSIRSYERCAAPLKLTGCLPSRNGDVVFEH